MPETLLWNLAWSLLELCLQCAWSLLEACFALVCCLQLCNVGFSIKHLGLFLCLRIFVSLSVPSHKGSLILQRGAADWSTWKSSVAQFAGCNVGLQSDIGVYVAEEPVLKTNAILPPFDMVRNSFPSHLCFAFCFSWLASRIIHSVVSYGNSIESSKCWFTMQTWEFYHQSSFLSFAVVVAKDIVAVVLTFFCCCGGGGCFVVAPPEPLLQFFSSKPRHLSFFFLMHRSCHMQAANLQRKNSTSSCMIQQVILKLPHLLELLCMLPNYPAKKDGPSFHLGTWGASHVHQSRRKR